MIALPQYIDADAWAGFLEMRRAIKKPLTVRAAKLVVYELQRIKDAGHDANSALDQSTTHCWADVYPAKEKSMQVGQLPAETLYQRSMRERMERASPMIAAKRPGAAPAPNPMDILDEHITRIAN